MTDDAPRNGWRTFVVLWLTESLSVLGDFATLFATTVWLARVLYPAADQRRELAAALAAVNIAAAVPALLGTTLFGVWVDRYDRRRLMLAANLANAVLSLLLAALVAGGGLNLWLLLSIVALMSVFSELQTTAFDASYIMVVPQSRLPRANGMMQLTWSIADIAGPAIASGLIALPAFVGNPSGLAESAPLVEFGVALAVALNAVTFAVAAAALLVLHVPSPQPRAAIVAGPSVWTEVSAGVRFVWRSRPLLALLTLATTGNFVAGAAFLLLPLLVRFDLAADWSARGFSFESALALLISLGSVGGLLGGVLITAWGGMRTRRVYGVVVPTIAGGLLLAGAGLSRALFLTAALLLLYSLTEPFYRAHNRAIWQTQTPPELQGRVISARVLLAGGMIPVASALAGWAGGIFDPGVIIAVLGAALAVFGVAQLFNPTLRRVEEQPIEIEAPRGVDPAP